MAVSTIDPNGLNVGQLGGRRNVIINGAMQISQRRSSTSGVTASGYYPCDRWKYESNGEQTVTIEQSTDAPSGFSNSLKLTVTTADADIAADYARFTQGIEGQNVQSFAYGTSDAKTITISFWVKSSVTGAYALTMQNLSADMLYVQTYTINSANTWEYKQLSVTGDTSNAITSSNAQGFRPLFFLSAGTTYSSNSSSGWTSNSANKQAYGQTANIIGTLNATWQITGVMLETGDTATSFEHRSVGEELTLCERYYQNSFMEGKYPGVNTEHGNAVCTTAWNDGNAQGPLFRTSMRTTPTATIRPRGNTGNTGYTMQNDANKQITSIAIGSKVGTYMIISGATAGTFTCYSWELDAEV